MARAGPPPTRRHPPRPIRDPRPRARAPRITESHPLRVIVALATMLASLVLITQFAGSNASSRGNLLFVTGDGGTALGDDAARLTFFEGLGWTVTTIDDDAGATLIRNTADVNDVVYVSDSTGATIGTTLQGVAVGVVSEETNSWDELMYSGSSSISSETRTQVDVIDTSIEPTSTFSLGALTILGSSQSLSYWRTDSIPFPGGAQVLIDHVSVADRAFLTAFDTGATLYSANTAADRRLLAGWGATSESNWTADTDTLVERSIDWAASVAPFDGRPDLLFVTGNGLVATGDDSARRDFFEAQGWDVEVIDDGAGAVAIAAAAAEADVMYVSDTTLTTIGTTLRDIDIGMVVEDVSNWQEFMYGSTASVSSTGATQVRVADNTVYPTSTFPTGLLTTAPSTITHSFWQSSVVALPSGAQQLVEMTGSADNEFLVAFETGSTMYSSNTAVSRRVLGGWANPSVSTWGTNLETMVARSLIWAAGMLVVNSTGDAADASVGDGLCDTGGTNSNGDDECTLRAAIQEANATAGVERIIFDAPATEAGHSSGTWTITLGSVLPSVSATVDLDATTQPGWAGSPIVALDAAGIGAANDGLTLSGSGAAVRGVAMLSAPDDGITLAGSGGHTLTSNWIGLALDGSTPAGVGDDGVDISAGSAGNTVGGPNAADRNVVAASASDGILDQGVSNVIEGNYVGTDATGLLDRGNAADGISLNGSPSTIVRGNVSSGNGGEGIGIDSSSSAVITGNLVGLGSDGLTAIGNDDEGIDVKNTVSTDVMIGGLGADDGNTVAHNADHGIRVSQAGSVRNTILGNTVFANTGLGIDLNNDNIVTANDAGDADAGANDLLNFPVITGNDSGTIDFDLDVPAGDYLVEAFRNPSGNDATGNGEGEISLGVHQIAHTGSGSESFTGTFSGLLSGGDITMTATECDTGACAAFGSTSEFSAAAVPTPPTQNLVMVTSDGTTSTNSKVTALAALFSGWGWSVTAIDDDASASDFTNAAGANNVMFLTDTAGSSAGSTVRDLDIGIVSESFTAINQLFHSGAGDQDWTSATTVTIVDDAHPITAGFSAGSLTIHTSANDVNYWNESATAFPAGITVLADSPTSTSHGALFVAETGAALASANTAAERRVWFPSDASSPSNWTTDYETLLERSLSWAAGMPTGTEAVGQWRFDEGSGTTALDSSGNGNDGTISGSTPYVGGVSNTALGFFGDARNVEVPDPAGEELDRGAGEDLTLSVWVRLDDDLAAFDSEPIAFKTDFGNDPSINGYELLAYHDGTSTGVYFKLWDDAPIDQSSGVAQVMDTTTTWADGQWHHVVGVVRGSSLELWVDGTLAQSTTHSAGDLSNTEALRFGGYGSPTTSFPGIIDEVAVWNRALSSGEISTAAAAADNIVVVNSTGDGVDASVGNGICTTGGTNSGGAAECTLRAAIQEANASASIDTIHFAMPTTETGHSSGVWTITPGSVLPGLTTASLVLDASTQTGFASTPVVEVDGTSTVAGSDGLELQATGITVRGFAINRFSGDAIEVDAPGSGATIVGNHLGVDPSGLVARANGAFGVDLQSGSTGSTIGGTIAAHRNVIAANNIGIYLNGSDGNTIIGNHIGTDATGNAAVPNTGDGIYAFNGADNNTIGQSGAGNVISGNGDVGIEINGATAGNTIRANIIGLGADGTTQVSNSRHGIVLYDGVNTTQIGGTGAGEGNTISSNADNGVVVDGFANAATADNVIVGNVIGLSSDRTTARGNGNDGISVFGGAGATIIGGTASGSGNVISGNVDEGIQVSGASTGPVTVLGNELRSNTGLGIDLVDAGDPVTDVTSNDADDGDTGPNDLLNFPVIAAPEGGSTTLDVDLDAPAGAYRIEVFRNPTAGADASGYGEGETLVHAQTVTSSGAVGTESFTLTGIPAWTDGDVVTATATQDLGGGSFGATSEFALAATATPGPAIVDGVDDVAAATTAAAEVVDVAANDTDANADAITVVDVTDPANGTATTNGDGTVTYTSDALFTGVDTFDYWAIDAGATLSHLWGLDGDGVDDIGTSNGTLTGTTTVAGDFGQALSFDEVDDRVTVPDFAYGSDFTISFDFKIDDNTGSVFQYLYSHGDVNGTNSINVLIAEGSHGTDPNVLRTVVRDSDDTLSNTALDTDIASLVGDGLWHTYTVTAGSGGLTVYVDGVAVASDPTRGTGTLDATGSLFLGARQNLDATRFYGGELDTVQVYERALNPSEVSDLAGDVNRATATMTVSGASNTVAGTIFEDVDGDGAVVDDGVGAAGVDVWLFDDSDGDGEPSAGDAVVDTTFTDGSGDYTLDAIEGDGTYWVAVNASDIAPSAGYTASGSIDDVFAEQTYGPVGAATFNGAWSFAGVAGALFGGARPTASDGFPTVANAEHVTRVVVAGADVIGLDHGFSFTPVTNTIDEALPTGFTDTAAWTTFDPGANGVGLDPEGFDGALFDGRYVYFSPNSNTSGAHGEVLRYDTTASFSSSAAWSAFDPGANGVGSDPDGYEGLAFDGRFVYFAPADNGTAEHGEVLRYDTIGSFTAPSSWTTFDPSSNGVGTDATGYDGAFFDGRYVYLSPEQNNSGKHAEVLRYDTTGSFTSAASWSSFDPDAAGVGTNPVSYIGIASDGRYLYFAPNSRGGARHGEILRYDSVGSFTATSSWTTFDPGANGVGSDPDGFNGIVFDGRHVYFVPYDNGTARHGEVLRYDTTAPFGSASSWETFDAGDNGVGTDPDGYRSAVFDGRHVYFVPYDNGTARHGEVLRYDTSGGFGVSTSWSTFDPGGAGVGVDPDGYSGAGFDGRFIYFAPDDDGSGASGEVLRYDTQSANQGSFRQFIENSNAVGGTQTTNFEIPASDPGHTSGVWTISPVGGHPAFEDTVVVDATTQPGWTADPVIELDGTGAVGSTAGVLVWTSNSTIRGLSVHSFPDEGIEIDNQLTAAANNVVAGNWIGVDADGVARGNTEHGVLITTGAVSNTVGGAAAGDANVIAANGFAGVFVRNAGSTDNVVEGNLIGVLPDGLTAADNGQDAVDIAEGADRTVVRDNSIAHSGGNGVEIAGAVDGVVVQGNSIGTDPTLTAAWPGRDAGIQISGGATNSTIGGTGVGQGNRISNAGTNLTDPHGISIWSDAGASHTLLGNSLVGNSGLGIDLAGGTEDGNGVTANDADDVDTGPNDLLNHPVLGSTVDGATTIDLDLDVPAGDYRIEVYANPTDGADASGYGEGETLIHAETVTATGAAGAETFALSGFPALSAGDVLTATATQDLGGGTYGATSELSLAVDVAAVSVRPDPEGGATTDRYSTTLTGMGPVAYWRLGETTGPTATDEVGVQNGSYVGATPGASGALSGDVDTAADFDGVDDHVDVGTFDVNGTGLTVTAWVNADSFPVNEPRIISKATGTSRASHTWMLSLYDDSGIRRLRGRIRAGSDTDEFLTTSGAIQVGQWHFVAMTYDQTSARLWLDGVEVGTFAHDTGGPVDLAPATPVWIGGNPSGATDRPWDGRIDEPAVFDRALSAEEIRVLHGAGRQYYSTVGTTPLTISAGEGTLLNDTSANPLTTTLVTGPSNAASFTLNSDGSFDYTAAGGFSGTDSFVYRACDSSPTCGDATVTITVLPSTVVVNSTGDASDASIGDGVCHTGGDNAAAVDECTLRAAIEEANASSGIDTINFAIPTADANHASGVWTITPGSPLDPVTTTITIDATTQPGWTTDPVIGLDGTGYAVVPADTDDGLEITANDVIVTGMSVYGWADEDINVNGGNRTVITRSWFGLTPAGAVVENPTIMSFGRLLQVDNAADTVVGGATDAEGNVFAAGGKQAISVEGASSNTRIENNHIGVRDDGTTPIGTATEYGIDLTNTASGTVITANQLGNLAVGAIRVRNDTSGTVITDNVFGTDLTGTVSLPVEEALVAVGNASATFGGTGASDGNIVRNVAAEAIGVNPTHTGTITILGNDIVGSTQLAIDLGEDGVTANDADDVDTGPNDLLNFPVLTAPSAGETSLRLDLDVPAGNHRIEIFSNPSGADPSGHGEGETLVHAETVASTGAVGAESFTLTGLPTLAVGQVLTATATEDLGGGSYGSTSEFSQAITVAAGAGVLDRSVRRHDMSAFGGLDVATPGSGVAGGGFDLAGGGERLSGPAFDPVDTAITMSGWVNMASLSGESAVVAKTGSGGTIHELVVDGGTGEAVARILVGASTIEARGGTVGTGTWHQLSATWDGADLRLYVDGAQVDTTAAVGTLGEDRTIAVTVGDTSVQSAALVGSADQITLGRTARSADQIATEYLNLSDPTGMVSLGAPQTEAPGAWATTTSTTRTGSHALDAPNVTSGASPWLVAAGLDEPGLAFESWWYLSNPAAAATASGTNTQDAPTDQREVRASASGLDLAAIEGATRTVDNVAGTTIGSATWTKVELRTDETGTSSVLVDGTQVIAPTAHATGTSGGSAGFRVETLPGGDSWLVDDVRLRRLVSDEPTTSLAPLHRQ